MALTTPASRGFDLHAATELKAKKSAIAPIVRVFKMFTLGHPTHRAARESRTTGRVTCERRRSNPKAIRFVGPDVHAQSSVAAVAEQLR